MADIKSNHKRQLIEKAKSSQFVVILVASIIISASAIGIKILWEQRNFQSEIISAKEEASDQLDSNLAAVESLKKEFIELEKSEVNSSLVLDALPSKYDFPALATSIEKLAAVSKVTLDSFSGDDVSETAENSSGAPQPVEIPFSISFSGSYTDVQLFISNLQKSIRPFVVDDYSIESSDAGIQINMKAKTFYQPSKNLEIRKKTITTSGAPQPVANPAQTVPGQAPSNNQTGVSPSAAGQQATGAAQ